MSVISLKRYASFLQQNHLDDFVQFYLKKNLESNLQYSSYTFKPGNEELVARVKEETELFFTQLETDKISDATVTWIEKLLAGNYSLVTGNITASDAVTLYNNRKYALLHFLPLYIADVTTLIEIIKTLETLFINQEVFIIQCFENLQQQTNDDIIKSETLQQELDECKTSVEKSESLAHVGHCEFDYSRGSVKCSEGFYKIIGIDMEEKLTFNFLKNITINENGFVPFSEKPSQQFKDGKPNLHEFKIIRSDSETRVLCSNDYPITDESGGVIGYRSFIQDITKIKKTEEQLKEGQSQIKKILDFSPTIIAIYDLEEDRLVYINWTAEKIFGFPAEESLHIKFSLFLRSNVYPDDRKKIEERIKNYETLKDDEYSPIEYRLIDLDKKVRWVYSKAIVFKRKNEKVKHILFNVADVTELKEAEEELRYRSEQLMEAQRIAHLGSYDWNIKEDRAYISEELRLIYGFPLTKKEMTVSEFRSILKPGEVSKLENTLNRFQNESVDSLDTEYVIVMPDKSEKNIISRTKVFRNSKGEPVRLLGTVMDITSLKKTEEELKRREAQLLETQKISNVGSFEWDIEPDKVTGTEEFFRIFNFPPDKKGLTTAELKKSFLDEEERLKFEANVEEAFKSSQTFESEYKIQLPDKSEKYIISRSQTLYDESGKPIRLIGSTMDITSLKKVEIALHKKNEELHQAYNKLEKAQEKLKTINEELEERVRVRTKELKESKELYQAFIKQSSVGVWRFVFKDVSSIDTTLPVDKQVELILKHSHIAEANKHFAQIFDIESTEEFIGHQFSEFLLVSEEKKRKIYKEGILNGYRLDDYEVTAKTFKGKTIHVQGSAIGMVEDKKLIGGWGIIRDVTERRRAVEALKTSEEQYRFLAETVPTIFWSAHPDGTIDYANQRWYEYTGSTYQESQKKQWYPFIHPDDFPKTEKIWKESIEAGKGYEMEYRLKRADGAYRWHLGKAEPLKDMDGNIIKWMGTSTDIHEQKNFTEKLEQKNEELDNFIYSASHDLKSPIANIEGLLTTLESVMNEENIYTDDISAIITMMKNSIDKFRENLLDLIEITRAQQRGEETEVENDLTEIVKAVESSMEKMIADTHAEIIMDFKEYPAIKFPTKNLESILYNLVSNAIKYRSPDRRPRVIVSTKELNDYILLSVKDNGRGLDSSQVEKVFSQFKRFHSDVEGSGVGLYIIKRIITNAGGKVDLESEKGKGSVFKVYFKKSS